MLRDGMDTLIDKFQSHGYDIAAFEEEKGFSNDVRDRLFKKLTSFYVDQKQISKKAGGSHNETYTGPYIMPRADSWHYMGERSDVIADAYIRCRILVHWGGKLNFGQRSQPL